ncbi:Arabinogalactan endo-beta-1,4-galactanase [Mycena venus]|uniref:Arabinogalactan endo-beta-1,4-galactanase n=1 Tax=Mycena venus TaxID=2733690 RepID=A0A8H7CLC3_9AGAR|nr:Arabinogalactan endo-beta-1,4-galactanase [Mycena venus]
MRFSLSAILLSIGLAPRISALTYHGADFSSLINLENVCMADFRNIHRLVAEYALIISSPALLHGTNLARIRIWTSTNNADYSLTYVDTCVFKLPSSSVHIVNYASPGADPGHQAIPVGWPTDLAGLNTKIFTAWSQVVTQGTPATFIEIGNEINDGFLWPTGQISVNGYSPLSQMMHSAVNGARSASSTIKTVVHLANGWDAGGVSSFYNQIFIAGEFALADVDVMGPVRLCPSRLQFHPFYGTGATFSALQSSLQAMVTKYGKRLDNKQWVLDIKNVLAGPSGSHGIGIIYWEPGWVGNAGLGSSCVDALLVDSSGNTRTSDRDVLRRHVVEDLLPHLQ